MSGYDITHSELTDCYYIMLNGKKVAECTKQISNIKANAIYEFAKWLEEKDYLNKTEIDYDWDEHSYLDIVSMAKEEILEEYMDWLATEKN